MTETSFGDFETVDRGFAWMESFTNLEKIPPGASREYRLDRMEFLSRSFGRPEKSYRVIHVAGSKGKGSTSLYLAAGLAARGYKTGLYTSPHVTSYKERITLAGKEIPDGVFLEFFNEIRRMVDSLDTRDFPGKSQPTTFELLTLLAFLVFRHIGCSWVVLETGLGGRLDATNICLPEASVITPIEREHTEYLGETIPEIAREKGGIIKQGKPVFCGFLSEPALKEITFIAAKKEAPCRLLAREASVSWEILENAGEKKMVTRVVWNHRPEQPDLWNLSMQGPHQGQNAALAALVLETLFAHRGGYPRELLKTALESASLPGRMEVFRQNGTIWVLDGAHTPDSLALTVDTFRQLYGDGGVLLFGSVLGKPVAPLADKTIPWFSDIIISRAGTFKPEDPRKVFRIFAQQAGGRNVHIYLEEDPGEAFQAAVHLAGTDKPVFVPDRPVLVTGSFYMAAAVRPKLLKTGDLSPHEQPD